MAGGFTSSPSMLNFGYALDKERAFFAKDSKLLVCSSTHTQTLLAIATALAIPQHSKVYII